MKEPEGRAKHLEGVNILTNSAQTSRITPNFITTLNKGLLKKSAKNFTSMAELSTTNIKCCVCNNCLAKKE